MSYTLSGFERFCEELVLKDGGPLRLEPFQRRMLRDHFRGVVEEVVIIPKKNGKTTLFAALALYHLREWPKADVVVVATSAQQAGILFEQAADMVESSELGDLEVRGRFGGAYRQIRRVDDPSSRLRVLAADAGTTDGELPTLALVDELHHHRNGSLYGVLRDGIDARDGRMVSISTAGSDEESFLGQLRAKAQEYESYQRRGARCYAVSEDGSLAFHEWSLTDQEDRDDLNLVKRANPLSNQTVEKLRRRKSSASMTPGRWARFACGVWTAGEESWLEADEWDRLSVDIGGVAQGEQVYAAVVYGINPAIAIAAVRPEDVTLVEDEDETVEVLGAAVKVWIFDGKPRYTQLEKELLSLANTYELVEVAYDEDEFGRSAVLLEQRGLPMMEIPLSPKRIAQATMTVQRVIHAGILRHDGGQQLRSQMLRSVIKETNRTRFFERTNESRGVLAMAVAVSQATQAPPPRSVYEDRELMVL